MTTKREYMDAYVARLTDAGIRLLLGCLPSAEAMGGGPFTGNIPREAFDHAYLIEYAGALQEQLRHGDDFTVTGPPSTYDGGGEDACPRLRLIRCPVCDWRLLFSTDGCVGFYGGVHCYVCQHHFPEDVVWAGHIVPEGTVV